MKDQLGIDEVFAETSKSETDQYFGMLIYLF